MTVTADVQVFVSKRAVMGKLGQRIVQVVLQSVGSLRRVNSFDVLPCKVRLRLRRDGVPGSWDPMQYEVLAAPGLVDSVRRGAFPVLS